MSKPDLSLGNLTVGTVIEYQSPTMAKPAQGTIAEVDPEGFGYRVEDGTFVLWKSHNVKVVSLPVAKDDPPAVMAAPPPAAPKKMPVPSPAPAKRAPRICDDCETEFTPKRPGQRFCSAPCSKRWHARHAWRRKHAAKVATKPTVAASAAAPVTTPALTATAVDRLEQRVSVFLDHAKTFQRAARAAESVASQMLAALDTFVDAAQGKA